MSNPLLTALLMWHIGSVILWLGSSATFVTSVYPSLGTLDQEHARTYLRAFLPKFSRVLGGATISAAIAGLLLFGEVSSTTTVFTPTGWRFAFVAVGALLGMVAAVLTLGVAVPLASRFMNPAAQVSNGPKYSVLDEATMIKGLNGVMRSTVVILLLVFVFMLLGAYT